MQMRKIFVLAAFVIMLAPAGASSAPKFEYSGGLTYWKEASSTMDALAHIDQLTEINPFVYVLQKDGTIADRAGIADEPWRSLITVARAKKVRVIPTIMSSDTATLHAILSNTKRRIQLEDDITALVYNEGFDGIDIDFEGKRAEDKAYFSTFLRGLYQRMGKKWVMCTIESRTPIADRYYGETPPKDAGLYANDFVQINKYCDRVRFMTYDKGRIDLKLNAANADPYTPISDPKWVEKTINLAAQTIPKRKIALGIPTYGYEWMIQPTAGKPIYDLLWSFNYKCATSIAETLNITPTRNLAGELFFSYVPTNTPVGLSGSYRVLAWPDAQSIADHITLAKKLGIRGVAIFKFDGGEDQRMWGILR